MLKAIIFDMDDVIVNRLPEQNENIPVSGVKTLIEELHKNQIRLAVTSFSSNREIEGITRSFGLQKYLDKLFSAPEATDPFPSPEFFLYAIEKMGLSPKEVLVVSASQDGILAADAAGIASIGYYNASAGDQPLDKAAVVVGTFEDLDTMFFENVLRRSQGEPVTIANTRRLIIRELAENDIEDMYKIYQDPQVKIYIDNIDDYKEAEANKLRAYIKNVYSFYGYGLWGVFSKTTKGLIGRCGIENHIIDGKEEIMLSYILDSHHWGYGYALECCKAVLGYARDELGIERIVAVIDKKNQRSINTVTKLDMKPEKEILYQNRDSILYVKEI